RHVDRLAHGEAFARPVQRDTHLLLLRRRATPQVERNDVGMIALLLREGTGDDVRVLRVVVPRDPAGARDRPERSRVLDLPAPARTHLEAAFLAGHALRNAPDEPELSGLLIRFPGGEHEPGDERATPARTHAAHPLAYGL